MSSAEDCLFCTIVAGGIPADVVHETATTLAFRDVNPQAPTHVLVIPRTHVADAAELAQAEPETLVQLVGAAREIAAAEGIAPGAGADGSAEGGYRLVFNTGAAAHQTVFHAHLHVLGGRSMTWPPG
ncbi:MAG: histidine triad protein [Marmoricola sp.]|nr:histidine triad protein [Marmoricola sp.]